MDWTYLGVEILKTAALYTMLSIGVNLLWNSNKFFDFGHSAQILLGAYGYLALHTAGFPWYGALLGALCGSVGVALVSETLVYAPMRRMLAAPLMCMVASFGIMTVAQGMVLLRFGGQTYTLLDVDTYIQLGAVRVSEIQLTIILVGALVFCLVGYMYTRTKLGLSMRAVADSVSLARVLGVPVDKIRLWNIVLAAICAGVVGVLVGLNGSITPAFAMPLLLNAFVVAMIFGLGNVVAGAYGALILSALQTAALWVMGAGWSEALSFLCLVLLLLFRSSQKTYGISSSS